MRLRFASIAFAALYASSAFGMTNGELYQATVVYVEQRCSEAFAAHKRQWPPADATSNVAWQNPELMEDRSPSRFEAPLPEVVTKFLAFNLSQYAPIDDFARIHGYAQRPAKEPGEYFYLYVNTAERLVASVDVYACLRPSADELVAVASIVNSTGADKLVEEKFDFTDRIAEKSAEMAEKFLLLEPEDVHAALQPYVNVDKQCGSKTE